MIYPRITIGTFSLLVAVIAPAHFSSVSAQDAEGPAADDVEDTAPKDELSGARLEYMLTAMEKYTVILDGEDSEPATLDREALMRWSNPLGDVMDGLLTVYRTSPGARPAIIAHFHVHGMKSNWLEMHEFSGVHPGALELRRGRRSVWVPEDRYGSFQELEGAPEPSMRAALRLSQMKRMAERFEVFDAFREPNSQPVRQPLRMMSRPIYRYGSEEDGEILDGVLFTWVLTTDPEASLLVEIHRSDEGYTWKYAFFPMSIYTLDAELDGETVWTKPEAFVFSNPTAPHYPARYRGDPGESRIRTLFPMSDE